MSAGWSQRHRSMLRAVAEGRIECDMTRGAWVGPDYKRRMGCYQWSDGVRLTVTDVQALIELRDGAKILTVPTSGTDHWPVKLTRDGEEWVARLTARKAVES